MGKKRGATPRLQAKSTALREKKQRKAKQLAVAAHGVAQVEGTTEEGDGELPVATSDRQGE